MFGTLVALSLMQAAGHAAPIQVQDRSEWEVLGNMEGCLAHAAYSGGTVLTVFAAPEREGIGFVLQNPGWTDLEHGAVYPLEIRFGEGPEWIVPALARADIDEDGPGLVFVMPPGTDTGGRDFMTDFALAADMRIFTGGIPVDRLALGGSHQATVRLAQCLTVLMDGGASLPPGSPEEGAALKI